MVRVRVGLSVGIGITFIHRLLLLIYNLYSSIPIISLIMYSLFVTVFQSLELHYYHFESTYLDFEDFNLTRFIDQLPVIKY